MLLLAPGLLGCGGGALSQEDMKKMGIRRKKDEDPPKVAQAASPPKSPQASKQAETPQTEIVAKTTKSPEQLPQSKIPPHKKASSISNEPLSDTRSPPARPLSLKQRHQLSAENLEKIGQAFEAYLQDKRAYPPRAISDNSQTPLLSWRVELLPYLGYDQLYQNFDITKPWNSPANKPLIKQIPAVYQSPERFDTRTNYLIAGGASTVFPGLRTANLRRIEDGIEHTLLAVEADDDLAVVWTKPAEYSFDAQKPKQGLGQLRAGKVFVIWGGGVPGAVPLSTSTQQFKAMFTIDGGEPLSSYSINVPLDEEYFAKLSSKTQAAAGSSLTPSPTSSTSAGVSYRSAVPLNAGNSLSDEYAQAAQISYAMHQAGDALLWYYASCVVAQNGVYWDQDYHWIPALQRPGPTIHFCIGVRGRKGSTPARARHNRPGENQNRQEITQKITEVGEDFLKLIEQHAENVLPRPLAEAAAAESQTAPRRSRRPANNALALPISYLGTGSRVELLQQAKSRAGDVLVMFETSNTVSTSARWVSCELVDLVRGKTIVSLPRIHWQKGVEDLASLERNESFKKKRWLLQDTLEDTLTFQEWPEGLKPKHAEARLASLTDMKMFNTLAALAEMSVYRNRQLIDNKQLLDGFRGLLGDEQGEALMLGSDKKRRRTLRTWLPADDPSELQQLAQLRRARDDDDD
ncbi:MAG: DUF1559 domain-containing protein [Pirellulales bacterium]|nr:DUF1559 domain-containing protein [Pirellulales bacterium]